MGGLRYLVWAGGSILVLAAATVLLCVAVDPYRMYGTPAVPGWTALKPRIYQREDMVKTYLLERVAPKTLLLGNSRVEVGFDPASQSWPQAARPVFNAAEAGRGLFTALRLLEDAVAVRAPQQVIVGLDFPDFLHAPSSPGASPPPVDAEDRRLLVDREGKPDGARQWQVWRDRIATTLTIDALLDSLDTLRDQEPLTTVTMTPLGFNPLREYNLYVAREGYHELFAQKDAAYAHQYSTSPKPSFSDPRRFESFRLLQRIITVADSHHIALVLVIYPYHANFLEMLNRLGLWPSFEAWKRALVRVVTGDAGAGAFVRIYDFSGYDPISTEPVPPAGDTRSQMRWYWESGHFKAALGDLLVARIFGLSADFGVDLNAADVDEDLSDIRTSRTHYLADENKGVGSLIDERTGK